MNTSPGPHSLNLALMDYGKGTGMVNAAPPTSFRTYVSALKGALEVPVEHVRRYDPTGAGLVRLRETGWGEESDSRQTRLKHFIHSAGVKRIKRVWMKLKGVDSSPALCGEKTDIRYRYKYIPGYLKNEKDQIEPANSVGE